MLKITVEHTGHPRFLKAAAKRGLEQGLMDAVAFWHKKFAPKHFGSGASQRYGYAKRTAAYVARKLKRHHLAHSHINRKGGPVADPRPLEFTGLSRRRLLRYIKIKGTSVRKGRSRAQGAFKAGGRYFWQRPAGHPDKAHEFLRTRPDEVRELQQVVERRIERELRAASRIKTRKRVA